QPGTHYERLIGDRAVRTRRRRPTGGYSSAIPGGQSPLRSAVPRTPRSMRLAPARVRWGGRLRRQLGARGRDQPERVRRVALRATCSFPSAGAAPVGGSLLYHGLVSSLAVGGAPVS